MRRRPQHTPHCLLPAYLCTKGPRSLLKAKFEQAPNCDTSLMPVWLPACQVLEPSFGGNCSASLDAVVAKLTRAKAGKGYHTAREALLLNGRFVLAQVRVTATAVGRVMSCWLVAQARGTPMLLLNVAATLCGSHLKWQQDDAQLRLESCQIVCCMCSSNLPTAGCNNN